MPRAAALEATNDGSAGKREIANCVEDFVTHEFVRKTPEFRIAQTAAVDRERVRQRRAVGLARAAQRIQFMNESERARGRDLAPESFARKRPRQLLRTDGGCFEINSEIEHKRLCRRQR